ncbi:MAG: phosphoglycerate dehydrogenase [Bradymonadales bacterium]|nr:MAG: phosphoglycerate dehydrogenase [Bradymonadales bacterium]
MPEFPIKALLLENIHPVAEEILRAQSIDVKCLSKAGSKESLKEELKGVHVLGIRSKTQITKEVLDLAPELLVVGCFCIGTNQVDISAARLKGCPVFNAPYANTRSVAELVVAEIVMLSRKVAHRSALLHQGRWEKSASACFEVRGKTLGIVGYGHIGSQLGILAEDLGMRVFYYDIAAKMPIGNCRPTETLEELLKLSDFVSFHVPETESTKNMISHDRLKLMKKGSYLLNASRGSVVDLEALANALKSRHLEGAAIDVFPEEPEGSVSEFKNPLQNIPNVILTPHIGGSTEEAQKNIGVEVATSLLQFVANGSSSMAVNFPKVDLPIQSDCHRVLNVHKNVPGVLAEITGIISEVGANIESQYLATDPAIGYLIVDLDKAVSAEVKNRVSALPASIKTRILF